MSVRKIITSTVYCNVDSYQYEHGSNFQPCTLPISDSFLQFWLLQFRVIHSVNHKRLTWGFLDIKHTWLLKKITKTGRVVENWRLLITVSSAEQKESMNSPVHVLICRTVSLQILKTFMFKRVELEHCSDCNVGKTSSFITNQMTNKFLHIEK